ncbi:uncharacterized protein TNCV_4365401 [Trichonephila clavipes]|nr:uncharacterized protein TNCV_4365401 [Trichonephila clavipes]
MAWVRSPMPPNTLRVHMDLQAEIVEVEIQIVSPSIVPSGNFTELNRTVTCMVLKANDRRTSCPCHDEFHGPRSDYVRQIGLAIHQNDHQARRRFVEWAQNEIAVVPDFHKRILFNDEAHFWLNGYVNKQNCRIWSEANPKVYVETPLHPEKLTVWCALWAGGILLQKR